MAGGGGGECVGGGREGGGRGEQVSEGRNKQLNKEACEWLYLRGQSGLYSLSMAWPRNIRSSECTLIRVSMECEGIQEE